MKSGNAEGGKGPQFKTSARSRKGGEIGKPANSNKCSETIDGITRQSEGRIRVPVLPSIRQDLSTGRARLCLPKLQGQQRGRRSGWSKIRRYRILWRRTLAWGTGGTAEEARLPTGSGQAGLDSEAERQAASLGDTHDHRPSGTNGRADYIGAYLRGRSATGEAPPDERGGNR
jgi:hypothetical protein